MDRDDTIVAAAQFYHELREKARKDLVGFGASSEGVVFRWSCWHSDLGDDTIVVELRVSGEWKAVTRCIPAATLVVADTKAAIASLVSEVVTEMIRDAVLPALLAGDRVNLGC